ncbi:MAG: HK97 family phage prohead protease [Sphingopyxis granuli]
MSAGIYDGQLELRARRRDGSRRLKGKFPYKKRAVLDAGGDGRRPKKEEFAPKAFSFAVEKEPEREIHLLSGHSFDKPLASKKAGTLVLKDTPEALEFEAVLTKPVLSTSWGKDFVASHEAGLIGGISPGFRVAPRHVVPTPPETTAEENPAEGNALIRTIHHAVLFELSLVTRPAYLSTLFMLLDGEDEGEDGEEEEDEEERSAGGIILPRTRIFHHSGRWR